MRLSPLDIQHMEFQRTASGYRRRQVREFLERVALEREELLRDLQNLREELDRRDEQIAELQAAEAELQRAIIAAERIGNEIKENAKKEAHLILQEAERLKEERLHEAEARLRAANAELSRVEREYSLFREQFRGMLEAYARSLESQPRPGAWTGRQGEDERQPAGEADEREHADPAPTGPH
ncbi:MAG: DivIVA domain-containing protein [Deinococcales bacterium]